MVRKEICFVGVWDSFKIYEDVRFVGGKLCVCFEFEMSKDLFIDLFWVVIVNSIKKIKNLIYY